MAILTFDASHLLGRVREVDTRKVFILVNSNEDLRKARVGQLVSLQLAQGSEAWLIGIIEKVVKSVAIAERPNDQSDDAGEELLPTEEVVNTVRLTLVGTVRWDANKGRTAFSRSLVHVPEIDAECYALRDKQLEIFMNVLSAEGDREHSLEIGKYTIDESATAFLDGNKLFQRHAALLGSTY